ncbi:unnamed protein product, partial [Mesorhabditis spiculigera]
MPPKNKKAQKGDDWEAAEKEAQKKLANLQVKEDPKQSWSDESDEEPVKAAPSKPMNRNAFMMMEDDDLPSEKSDSEPEDKAPVPAPAAKAKKDKKKKDTKAKKTEGDDDLDALLDAIEKPAEPAVGKKKKGKKDKEEKEADAAKEVTPEGDADKEPAEGGEDETSKADKKKKKKRDKKEKKDDEEKPEGDEAGEEGGGKKKGKEKKLSKQAKMIQDAMRKQEEMMAELKRKEEEEQARIEAAEKKREEEERIAKERKDAEKLRKKEKEEELKRQGKYLTAAQKNKQAQQLARLGHLMDRTRAQAEAKKDGKKEPVAGPSKPPAKPAPVAKTPEPKPEPEPVPATQPEPTPVPTQAEDDELDDWEAAAEEAIAEQAEAVKEEKKPDSGTAPKPVAKTTTVEDEVDETESEAESSSEDESDSDSDESSSDDERVKETKEEKMDRIRQEIQQRREKAIAKKTTDDLRAPIICVLGHVDTGKTKLLDTIRRTNVQEGEAGGITQQIGATEVPKDAIIERCRQVREFKPDAMKIPGFLIIDTPGHEHFANLRSRGSSLCDFAILVVDLMHGLEPQTIESIKLLVKRKTPFVVALNKIDRLHQYESSPKKDVYVHLKSQASNVQLEFKKRYDEVVVQFAEQGLNVCLSNDKKTLADPDYIPMVPTSAFCGDGVGNLMAFAAETTQTKHADRLAFVDELEATVMEVKAIPGLGTTIDVILVNGRLRVNDLIVLSGTEGPILTAIRDLKMPEPLKELRVKNEYRSFKEVRGAQGIKLLAKNLDKALAGFPLYVGSSEDELDVLMSDCKTALDNALTSIKKKNEGVYVQASTLGSLEALLEFLKSQKIPYANVNIGPVHKKDVQKAAAMKEHGKEEYACILAFDVRVEREAQLFADREGIRIFKADIIYHLEDDFLKYREELRMKKRREHEHLAIFPCKLRILPQHVFNARNPIVVGVSIEAGQLKKGTPICVPSKEGIWLGNISSIQKNHDEVNIAKAGEEVCVKIENTTGDAPKLYGRHFTHEDMLVSRISRESIDVLKAYFREELTKADWQLVIELKKVLDIL